MTEGDQVRAEHFLGVGDIERVRATLQARLPRQVRWLVGDTPWDFNFSKVESALLPVGPSEVSLGGIEQAWTDLLLFGTSDWAVGGGAHTDLGVHRKSGQIMGLDVERVDDQLFLLNSNVETFIATFLAFDAVLRLRTTPLERAMKVAAETDSAFPQTMWSDFAAYLAGD